MASLLEAVLQVLTPFLSFLALKDLFGRAFAVGLGVRVCDTNVKDVIGSSLPKATNQDVPSFIFWGRFLSGWIWLIIDSTGGQGIHVLNNATGANEGFVTYC
jgi:hypothetical protein